MNILVLGSGGREHALAWKIAQDTKVTQVFVAPGNAGTATEAKCVNVQLDILDNPAIIAFAKENNVELIVVGPEAPLVNGVVDAALLDNLPGKWELVHNEKTKYFYSSKKTKESKASASPSITKQTSETIEADTK